MYDNTYRTNNKNLAFFQVISLNNHGKTFSCAFSFINSEKEAAFKQIIDQINNHRVQIGAQEPGVTITNFDFRIKSAVAAIYPRAKPQLCIFHINKNVALHIQRKWDPDAIATVAATETARLAQEVGEAYVAQNPNVGDPFATPDDEATPNNLQEVVERLRRLTTNPKEEEVGNLPSEIEYSKAGLYELWCYMVYSLVEELFYKAYDLMKKHFILQEEFLNYIETILILVKEQWATCFINKNFNFG